MLLVIAMVGMVAAYAFHRDFLSLYYDYRGREAEVQALREQVRGAQVLEKELSRRVDDLDDDNVEMEASIRRNKDMVREGETIYRVELPPEIAAGGSTPSQ